MLDIAIDENSKSDIAQAMEFYEGKREGLGEDFLDAVKEFLEQIAENPRLYPVARRPFHKAGMTRFPYAIYYQFDAHSLEIIGVIHAKRSKGFVVRRLKRPS